MLTRLRPTYCLPKSCRSADRQLRRARVNCRVPSPLANRPISTWGILFACIGLMWCVGLFGRVFWTPDEPREADITWRMSWQTDRSVPLLAGAAFCEKPPLTYWVAALPVEIFGPSGWAARLPNLLYGMLCALSVFAVARASSGRLAGAIAAATLSTLLLSYQVIIWLATDAPLMAAVAVALLGLYAGFYATDGRTRLRGYTLMHAALAAAFLSKSAAGWMVPALALGTLIVWERRFRELLRWELYPGLAVQLACIFTWIYFVQAGPDGLDHLRVFFWNNLVGRFTNVAAPADIQYTSGHHNAPGKYLLEMPLYLFPWTLLVLAALRHAWQRRRADFNELRPLRFALAIVLPALLLLSFAATARNIYFAPALPGIAILLGWWARDAAATPDRWTIGALKATAALLLICVILAAAAVALVGIDAGETLTSPLTYALISGLGLIVSATFGINAWRAARHGNVISALYALLMTYSILLIAPTSQVYARVNQWQDLGATGRAIARDTGGRPLVLFAPDETTQAFIDMYTSQSVTVIPAPADSAAVDYLRQELTAHPMSLVVAKLPSPSTHEALLKLRERFGLPTSVASHHDRPATTLPDWVAVAGLTLLQRYDLPHGRSYGLFQARRQLASKHAPHSAAALLMVKDGRLE